MVKNNTFFSRKNFLEMRGGALGLFFGAELVHTFGNKGFMISMIITGVSLTMTLILGMKLRSRK